MGHLPIIIDTEGNFDWNHAKHIGVRFEEVVDVETGEVIDYEGDFLFFDGSDLVDKYAKFDYSKGTFGKKDLRHVPVVEDVAKLINDMITLQKEGELDMNLAFFWDSIGSLGCYKGATSGANNNMWTAGALSASF